MTNFYGLRCFLREGLVARIGGAPGLLYIYVETSVYKFTLELFLRGGIGWGEEAKGTALVYFLETVFQQDDLVCKMDCE